MSTTTEFYRWWIVDEVTGERVLTPYKLTRAHAARAFPAGAEPNWHTREIRNVPDLDEEPWASRPGEPWTDTEPGAR